MCSLLRLTTCLLLCAPLASASNAKGGVCEPDWVRFSGGDMFGGSVHSLIHFDVDGAGPANESLIAGGSFFQAGGVPTGTVAAFDGFSWRGFGASPGATVHALASFDPDAAGPAPERLFSAGSFLGLNRVAMFDGVSWQSVGGGVSDTAYAMATFDEDGAGPAPAALFVGGEFSQAGAVAAPRIARWNGNAWTPVGAGVPGQVRALATFDPDGPGGPVKESLFAGTDLGSGGGVWRWDGSAWSQVAAMSSSGGVLALRVADLDGDGPQPPSLYAGGQFELVNGTSMSRVSRYDGNVWSPLGVGLNFNVRGLAEIDVDAAGPASPALYASGQFVAAGGSPANRIARWDGVTWSPLGSGMSGTLDNVYAVAGFDVDGPGPGTTDVYAGGFFASAGGVVTHSIARFDGAAWSGLGNALSDPPLAFTTFDFDGSGPAAEELVAAGTFATAGGKTVGRLARLAGTSWQPIGTGVSGGLPFTYAATTHDADGAGPATPRLIVGGSFTQTGAVPAPRVAAFDGVSWSSLGAGFDNSRVEALLSFDLDGPGPALPEIIAGGSFTTSASAAVPHLARYDGTAWSALGGGANNLAYDLILFDFDGDGPEPARLIAGGVFTSVGGVTAARIAMWDGSTWSPLGAGFNGTVRALTTVDFDGDGPSPSWLIAAGDFTQSGPTPVQRIARFDGSSWQPLGSGCDGTVHSLASFDDGSGTALYAGGEFGKAGGGVASRLARFDGGAWSPVGGGASISLTTASVYALLPFEIDSDGDGTPNAALFVGGNFDAVGDAPSEHVAAWAGCPAAITCQPDIGFAGPGNATLSVCGDSLASGGTATLRIANAPPSSPAFLAASPSLQPTPLLGGTLVPVPVVVLLTLTTTTAGEAVIPGIPGGGGPFSVYVQAIVSDPSQAVGYGFTNAIRLDFLP